MTTSVFPSANKEWVEIHSFGSFLLLSLRLVIAVMEVAAILDLPENIKHEACIYD